MVVIASTLQQCIIVHFNANLCFIAVRYIFNNCQLGDTNKSNLEHEIFSSSGRRYKTDIKQAYSTKYLFEKRNDFIHRIKVVKLLNSKI